MAQMKHFVELTHAENQLMKAAMMAFVGALKHDAGLALTGMMAGSTVMRAIGQKGLTELSDKLNAHLDATKDDGSLAELYAELEAKANAKNPDQLAIDDLLKGGK